MTEKLFTVEQANALLPELTRELEALQETKRRFEREYRRLRELKELSGNGSAVRSDDPFFELEANLEFMQLEARTQIQSIQMKGVQLKDIDIGLIDFPARIGGKDVLLCWRQGEPKIMYYHGLFDGYAGRRPLPEEAE